MSTNDPGKPDSKEPQTYEAQINALLEGELDPAAAEALKAAAREDSQLAQAIVAAWQLRESLDQLAFEKAPASLSRRLKRIPLEHGGNPARTAFGLPGWALSVGVVAVAAVALALVMDPMPTGTEPTASQTGATPDAAEVAAARRDLAIAFSYLDKAGLRTSREIRAVLHEELAAPVKDNLSRHIPYMAQATKEKHA